MPSSPQIVTPDTPADIPHRPPLAHYDCLMTTIFLHTIGQVALNFWPLLLLGPIIYYLDRKTP